MSISIKWVRSFSEDGDKNYGGRSYNNATYDILSKNFELSFYDVFDKKNKKSYLRSLLDVFVNSAKIKDKSDIWIRDYFATVSLFLNKPKYKNVVYIQHIASTSSNKAINFLFEIYNYFFYQAVKKADAVITISSYWKSHFLERGSKNVYIVYPFIDTEKLNIADSAVESFKIKYNLKDKPIIYLGNCRPYKGVKESYELLKDLDVYFVTSGTKEMSLPCLHLNLDYQEYLCLLKGSAVVLFMSKFKEGWGLTAHEAMYLKTPVIGSGLGGNRELLEGGNQIISSFEDLKSNVNKVLKDNELAIKMGNEGHLFAKTFTKKRFEEGWISVINNIYNQKEI